MDFNELRKRKKSRTKPPGMTFVFLTIFILLLAVMARQPDCLDEKNCSQPINIKDNRSDNGD
jgi:hypothetical protein